MSQLTDALLDSGIFAWMECFFCFCVCVCVQPCSSVLRNEFVGEVCACRFLNELAEGAGALMTPALTKTLIRCLCSSGRRSAVYLLLVTSSIAIVQAVHCFHIDTVAGAPWLLSCESFVAHISQHVRGTRTKASKYDLVQLILRDNL